MKNVAGTVDRAEVRVVRDFAAHALARYNTGHDCSEILMLVHIWSLTVDIQDRKIVSRKILELLNRYNVVDPIIAREILRHVGSEVCQCPSEEAWRAVATFISSDHLLSVRYEAVNAALRLWLAGERTSELDIMDACREGASELLTTADPNVGSSAANLVSLVT